ncbi:hypothetical protein BOTBODRAFT_456401 [Botryobasidium botryosum FD-172 SS1]|uniref:Uncharacterized protein n=1 Tax=Botryobasidium botryosum (strain FD-172 SS1) TaxID=930990 RepID=A0A067MHW4_BOTB1|nr:hypothetical protein BOTBODRAFT_456401 [Botryobasidium botryosum FD-172 SS1]
MADIDSTTTTATTGSSSGFTLLRVKRKRTDEPLDALVLDLPTKRSRDGMFRFAETVEGEAFFADYKNAEKLQRRIANLSQNASGRASPASQTAPLPAPVPISASPTTAGNKFSAQQPTPRQYNIVKSKGEKRRSPSISGQPPVSKYIKSETLARKPSQTFTFYDAIPYTPAPEKTTRKRAKILPSDSPVDSHMANFLPMLEQYLSLHDISIDSDDKSAAKNPIPTSNHAMKIVEDEPEKEDDYVYDVFYYHKKDSLAAGLSQAANIGLVWVSFSFHSSPLRRSFQIFMASSLSRQP